MIAFRTTVGFLALGAFGVLARPAHAQEAPLTQAASQIMTEAAQAASEKNWALCRTRAVGVWDQTKSFRVAGLLGLCELELGMHVLAAEHLDFYLRHDQKDDLARSADVQAGFDRARSKVGLLEISCSENGAPAVCEAKVGAAVVGPTPQRVFVEGGAHEISGSRAERACAPQKIDIAIGGTLQVQLIVTGGSGANTEPAGGRPMWPGWLMGGVGIAAAGVGAALLGVGQGELGAAEDIAAELRASGASCEPPSGPGSERCAEGIDSLASAGSLSSAGIGLLAGGGALLIAGIVYLVVPNDDADPAPGTGALQLVPVLTPGQAGLVLTGAF